MSEPDDKTVSGPAPSNGQFVLWFLLLIAMIAAIFYNYSLLAGLMGEMVGGRNIIFGIVSEASLGAGVIVILEVFMGLFFLETRGLTTMFPDIHALKTEARRKLGAFCIFHLFMLALIGAGLFLMRDILAAEEGIAVRHDLMGQLPLAAWMAIAFILPFILILAPLSADRMAWMLRGQSV